MGSLHLFQVLPQLLFLRSEGFSLLLCFTEKPGCSFVDFGGADRRGDNFTRLFEEFYLVGFETIETSQLQYGFHTVIIFHRDNDNTPGCCMTQAGGNGNVSFWKI